MKTSDFDYELPPESIAQHPLKNRTACRMVAINRKGSEARHLAFTDFAGQLKPGDCLVLNDTKVLPCRVPCRKKDTGAAVEVFLLRPDLLDQDKLPALCRPRKKLSPGTILNPIKNSNLGHFEVMDLPDDGEGRVLLKWCGESVLNDGILEQVGITPLPPYITREELPDDEQLTQDQEFYQSVFAEQAGSCAAPTASLHFDDIFLDNLKKSGINIAKITLHVGSGTFLPVKSEDPTHHIMHVERYHLSKDTIKQIEATKSAGGRIVAVGTTVLRALESAWMVPVSETGWNQTDLFILPGFSFKIVDCLLTNFHQPRSTLLMLVCAMAGPERVLATYKDCISKGYRFLSYGDCMFVA